MLISSKPPQFAGW